VTVGRSHAATPSKPKGGIAFAGCEIFDRGFVSSRAPISFWQETKITLILAFPIIVGQVSQMLMGVTDSVMIGHVGAVPLAASALAGNIFGMFFVVGLGLLLPVTVLVARARGGREPQRCSELLRHGCWLGLGFGLLETLVMLVIGQQLGRFGQPPEVVAAVGTYFNLIAISLIPSLLFQVFRQYAEALGQPRLPMVVMLGGVIANVILNWILIYGRLGAPALGLDGAGWATLLSRILVLVVIVVWLARDIRFGEFWPDHWLTRISPTRMREMLRIGIPASGQLLFESGAFAAAAIMMGWLGTVPLAAHQIAISCAAVTFMFLLGLSMAVSIRVAEAVGSGERNRLRSIGFGALGIGTILMIGFALVFLVGADVIAARFVSDPAVIAAAGNLLIVAGIFQIFDGGQVVGSGALRGLADVRVPTLITFVAYWVIALPGGYALGFTGGFGGVGIWVALAAGLAFAAVLLAARYARLTRPTLA